MKSSDGSIGQRVRTCVASALTLGLLLGGSLLTAQAASAATAGAPVPTFTAHGSVEQIYVTDADAGAALQLLDGGGQSVQTGTADAQGSFIFRQVPVGTGYVVVMGSGETQRMSEPVAATDPNDPPDPSVYSNQQIGDGYGYLTTRDGTKLALTVHLPGPIDKGPYPTVIEYSGYDPANPDSPQPSTLITSSVGYAAVGINMRGTGCSGGTFDYFETLQGTDGYDAIEAIAAQPWVANHKVGMVGISYPGISQLFVAQYRPPHLTSIAPLAVIANTALGTLYPGGILNNGFAIGWAMDRQHDSMIGGQPWSQKRLDDGDQVCIDNMKLRAQTPDLLTKVYQNHVYDPAIGDPLAPATFVQKINVPVFLAGAWQDEQVGPHFATMLGNFTGTDKVHISVVNGGHIDALDPPILTRWMEFLSFYVRREIPHFPDAARLVLAGIGQGLFGVSHLEVEPDRFACAGDCHASGSVTVDELLVMVNIALGVTSVASCTAGDQNLDGAITIDEIVVAVNNAQGSCPPFESALARFESDPKIRVLFDSGSVPPLGGPRQGFERSFSQWPVEGVQPAIWYFQDGGRLDTALPTGDGVDSYMYDPSRSQVTSCHNCGDGVWLAKPPWDWQPLPDGKALAYVTDPLTDTLEIIGSSSIDLWLKSTDTDTDLQVTLSEVRPDGQETYVQTGWLRASHRKTNDSVSTILRPVQTHFASDITDLPAGEFVEARVELMPVAHVFRKDSRIRISIEGPGGDRPEWKFDARALPTDGSQVINTIAHSAAYPSRLVLPMVPDANVTTALPACASTDPKSKEGGLRGQPCRDYVALTNTPG